MGRSGQQKLVGRRVDLRAANRAAIRPAVEPVRFGVPWFVLDRFEAVYAEPVAGLRLEQAADASITATVDTVVLIMAVRADDGRVVGEVNRTFRRPAPDRSFARLSGVRLDRDVQGRGFGRALHEREARELAALGIQELSLEAALHGAAFWPELGFEPQERAGDAIAAVMDQSRRVIDLTTGDWHNGRGDLQLLDLVASRRISASEADELECLVRDPAVPFAEIVGFKREQTWQAEDGRVLWPGRALLAGARYEAVKRIS